MLWWALFRGFRGRGSRWTMVIIGLVMLIGGLVIMLTAESPDCGGEKMSANDRCIYDNGTTKSYEDEKESSQIGGGICAGIGFVALLVGALRSPERQRRPMSEFAAQPRLMSSQTAYAQQVAGYASAARYPAPAPPPPPMPPPAAAAPMSTVAAQIRPELNHEL